MPCITLKAKLLYLMRCKYLHGHCKFTELLKADYCYRIMFAQEFSVIDSAASAEKLKLRLKDAELEQYGDPVMPEYVYDIINRLPRFSSMRVSFSKSLTLNSANAVAARSSTRCRGVFRIST